MSFLQNVIVIAILACLGWFVPTQPVCADTQTNSDSTHRLQSAVKQLSMRLGSGSKAEGWRKYLLLNVLETQSAKGEQADIGTLRAIHQRFSAQEESLQHPVFATVRVALERQINSLSSAQHIDLNQAVADSKFQFRPITVELVERYRDLAKWELESLKRNYRANYSSYEHAKLFYALELDETLDFISEIEIEQAPEISVGKINSRIADVREQLKVVERKIDALPYEEETPEPDIIDDEANDNDPNTPPEPIEVGSSQDGPVPDDGGDTREDLRRQLEVLERRMEELQEQRREVGQQDLPRRRNRARVFSRLRKTEIAFEEQSKNFLDPHFANAQLAFVRLVRGYLYCTEDNLQEEFLKRMQDLADDVPKLNDPLDRDAAGKVGNTLQWLEHTYQVPNLVTAIRSRYSLPNAYVAVSSSLLNQLATQSVNDSRTIDENIDGRLVRGQLSTIANVALELQPDPNQVHVSIRLDAYLNSNTYLRQRKIYAFVNSNGQAEARRSIFANVGGLFAETPYAASYVDSQFGGTSSQLGLVNRIAQKKFAENKYKADVSAGNQFRDEVMERFTDQTDEPVAAGKTALARAMENANKIGRYLPELYAHSTHDRIVVVGKNSSPSTLAAPNRPTGSSFSSDIEVRLHETMLTNYLEPIFAGKEFSDAELATELESLIGAKPEGLAPEPQVAPMEEPAGGLRLNPPSEDRANEDIRDDEDSETAEVSEPFSISFAAVRPIQIQFENNGFAVTVNGRRFSQGENKISAGLKIVLRFKIKRIDGKLMLVRDGKAELDYADPDKKDAKIVAFRSFLDGRLNPEGEVPETEIVLPENLLPIDEVDALKDSDVARNLRLTQFRIDRGWLYIGWQYVPEMADAGFSIGLPQDLPAIWIEQTINQMEPLYTPVGEPEMQTQTVLPLGSTLR